MVAPAKDKKDVFEKIGKDFKFTHYVSDVVGDDIIKLEPGFNTLTQSSMYIATGPALIRCWSLHIVIICDFFRYFYCFFGVS